MKVTEDNRKNIVKISILSKTSYGFNAIPIKIPITFFYKTEQRNSKTCVELQRNMDNQSNFENKKQNWRYQILGFKLFYKGIVKNECVLTEVLTYAGLRMTAPHWQIFY